MIKTALIVDDSEAIRQSVSAQLLALGVEEVESCRNGKEALERLHLRPQSWECIITDLHMPLMDGVELLGALGKQAYRGGVIIASQMEERIIQLAVDIALSQKVHLIGALPKPLDENELARLLHKVEELKGYVPAEIHYIKKRQLIESIETNKILPYFQPKVCHHNGILKGFEVLCRLDWTESHEIVLPERFIPVAERFQLLDQLTYELMVLVLAQFAPLQDACAPDSPRLSFNISPHQLSNREFPNNLADICERFNVPASSIILEVTERQLYEDTEQLATLNRLRIHGFGLSLDDFGTGYTSVKQLRTMPFTEVKIDKSLIHDIHRDKVSQIILKALESLAMELKVDLVAEGIEHPADHEYIINNHRVIAQGFLISRPKPINDVSRWYRAWKKNQSES